MIRGGMLIKLAREARGMTQEEVAEAFGVNIISIQRWEASVSEPKFFTVHSIITNVCKLSLSTVEELYLENH